MCLQEIKDEIIDAGKESVLENMVSLYLHELSEKEEILDGKIEKAENKSLELEKINNELEAKRKEIDELKLDYNKTLFRFIFEK